MNRIMNITYCRLALYLASIIFLTSCGQKEAGSSTEFFKTLRTDHLRLIFTAEDQERIEKLRKIDQSLDSLIRITISRADHTIELSDIEFCPDSRNTILDASRSVRERLLDLAMAYRFTGDKKYMESALGNIKTVADFPTWNPAHFLDVAEMTAGVAIAYDWLYNDLNQESREFIREVIVEMGLREGLTAYYTDSLDAFWDDKVNWRIMENNWYFVTTGGLTLGALAVAEDHPEIAEEIIRFGMKDIQRSIVRFAPDGVWYEGPGYWGYAMYYLAQLVSGLESALGNDFGLSESEGLDRTSVYYVQTISPAGKRFTFADCGRNELHPWFNPAFLWLTRRFDPPEIVDFVQKEIGRAIQENVSSPLAICWYTRSEKKTEYENKPVAKFYTGDIDLFCYKSSDVDSNALYFIAKGGNNAINHQQLDIGTFVVESDGILWGVDLGAGQYSQPGFFSKEHDGQRWTYYRNQNKSHSTLVFGDRNQEVHGTGRLVKTSRGSDPFAIMDMTTAYEDEAGQVQRGYKILENSAVLIRDEISDIQNMDILRWAIVTDSDISISGNSAVFTKEGKAFYLNIIEPQDAEFVEVSTLPRKNTEFKNRSYRMLSFYVTPGNPGESVSLSVLMSGDQERVDKIGTKATQELSYW
ncbi:MAG: DUF4962 domain-containing protein [Bacteroidales bacterium]